MLKIGGSPWEQPEAAVRVLAGVEPGDQVSADPSQGPIEPSVDVKGHDQILRCIPFDRILEGLLAAGTPPEEAFPCIPVVFFREVH